MYYDIKNDILLDSAMEGNFGNSIKTGVKMAGASLLINLKVLINKIIFIGTKILSFAISNDKVIYCSDDFLQIVNGAKGKKLMGGFQHSIALIKEGPTGEKVLGDVNKIFDSFDDIVNGASDIKTSFEYSSETPNKLKIGILKKNLSVIMKHYTTLHNSLRLYESIMGEAAKEDAYDIITKRNIAMSKLKEVQKVCNLINSTMVKTIVQALVKAKKDEENK